MNRSHLSVLLATVLAACAPQVFEGRTDFERHAAGEQGPLDRAGAEALRAHRPLVVGNCLGGSYVDTATSVGRLREMGVRVVLRGETASACLMLLTLDNLCYEPGASFVFHGARNTSTGKPVSFPVKDTKADFWPPRLAAFALRQGWLSDPDRYVTISSRDLSLLDGRDRTCKGDGA
jgi:hypothetical protein